MVKTRCGAGALPAVLAVSVVLALLGDAEGFIGINYGSNFANSSSIPTPSQAVLLMKNLGVRHARIFGSDPYQISAFARTGIQLIISVQNSEVEGLGQSMVAASSWVRNNVQRHIAEGVNISGIAVGEEVFTRSDGSNALNFVLLAMNNLYAAVQNSSLGSQIAISTPQSTNILANSFPPSMGSFNQTLLSQYLRPVLRFLADTNSYFMLNLQPLYLFQQSNNAISLAYSLFLPNPGVNDTLTNLHYSNVFDAVLDAVYAALRADNFSDMKVVVLKTGWPSRGDINEAGVSASNAQNYNQNLVQHVLNGGGTPARRQDLDVYIYELFSEDGNQGSLSNRNWGLFYPNETAVYPIDLTGSGVVTNVTQNRTWCVAKPLADDELLPGLNWACGQGAANCTDIQPGMPCFVPNTVLDHASYAYNNYYQKMNQVQGTCDFSGTATITINDPSYPGCVYTTQDRGLRARSGSQAPRVSHFSAPLTCFLLLLVLAVNWGT